MKRHLHHVSSSPVSKKTKHDHSTWLNSVVLLSIYSFLPFREALNFRLVNHKINQELRISSLSDHNLFIVNRFEKINEMKEKSFEFFHGCLMKVNAEIRNCMVLSNVEYFNHLFEADVNFGILKKNEEYCKLFKDGIVKFNTWLGAVFSKTQGGRSEMKIMKKSNGELKEFLYLTQHYIYGPSTGNNVENFERFYSLKVRDSNNEEKFLIRYFNSYDTLQDEPIGQVGIDSKSIKEIMEKLEIPNEWNWKDFLKFLMTCTGALQYSFPDQLDGNSNIWEIMIREIETQDDFSISIVQPSDEMEGSNSLEEVIKPILKSEWWSYSQKLDHLGAIRGQILKICSSKACNIFIFGSWDDYDGNVDETMLQQIKSKLKYYTIHESCFLGFQNYVQEEKLFAEAVFKFTNDTLETVLFKYELVNSFEQTSISVTLTQNGQETTLCDLVVNILGIDPKKKKNGDKILTEFAKCLIKIFGQCHKVMIGEETEETTTTDYYQYPITECLEMLKSLKK